MLSAKLCEFMKEQTTAIGLLFLIQWSKESVGAWPAIRLAALRTIHDQNGHIVVVKVNLRSVSATRRSGRTAVVKMDDTVIRRYRRKCPAESILTVCIPDINMSIVWNKPKHQVAK